MKSVVYYCLHFEDVDFIVLSNVHFTRLLVEYGLVHRGETCYFCFDPAFVWPSLGRADFHPA